MTPISIVILSSIWNNLKIIYKYRLNQDNRNFFLNKTKILLLKTRINSWHSYQSYLIIILNYKILKNKRIKTKSQISSNNLYKFLLNKKKIMRN